MEKENTNLCFRIEPELIYDLVEDEIENQQIHFLRMLSYKDIISMTPSIVHYFLKDIRQFLYIGNRTVNMSEYADYETLAELINVKNILIDFLNSQGIDIRNNEYYLLDGIGDFDYVIQQIDRSIKITDILDQWNRDLLDCQEIQRTLSEISSDCDELSE